MFHSNLKVNKKLTMSFPKNTIERLLTPGAVNFHVKHRYHQQFISVFMV